MCHKKPVCVNLKKEPLCITIISFPFLEVNELLSAPKRSEWPGQYILTRAIPIAWALSGEFETCPLSPHTLHGSSGHVVILCKLLLHLRDPHTYAIIVGCNTTLHTYAQPNLLHNCSRLFSPKRGIVMK